MSIKTFLRRFVCAGCPVRGDLETERSTVAFYRKQYRDAEFDEGLLAYYQENKFAERHDKQLKTERDGAVAEVSVLDAQLRDARKIILAQAEYISTHCTPPDEELRQLKEDAERWCARRRIV